MAKRKNYDEKQKKEVEQIMDENEMAKLRQKSQKRLDSKVLMPINVLSGTYICFSHEFDEEEDR